MTTFAEKHYPEKKLHEELDNYLSRGWYRMGQTIFTTHFLFYGDQFYSAIWVRQPLKDYQYSKSLRKIRRRNGDRFQYIFRPAELSAEKERLYQRYRADFPGVIAPNLKESLLDGEEHNIFQTWETAIYDGKKLVAFSFFDLGHKAAAGILGVYDPDYSPFSLGLYTMLLEIEFCLDRQLDFYYPGYVVPGNSRFDYKLRIGPVEYYDLRTSSWLPFKGLDLDLVPIKVMQAHLTELQEMLAVVGVKTHLLNYPLFEANLFGFWEAPYLDYPIVLKLDNIRTEDDTHLIIVYDIRRSAFLFLHCMPFDDLYFKFNDNYAATFDTDTFFLELVIVGTTLGLYNHAKDLVSTLETFTN